MGGLEGNSRGIQGLWIRVECWTKQGSRYARPRTLLYLQTSLSRRFIAENYELVFMTTIDLIAY